MAVARMTIFFSDASGFSLKTNKERAEKCEISLDK